MSTLDQTFSALGDPTRRAILAHLTLGEARLSDIAEPFDMSQTGVTRHVHVLQEAGLVVVEKRGRTRYCRLTPAPLEDASNWIADYEQFWANRFEDLARYLGESE